MRVEPRATTMRRYRYATIGAECIIVSVVTGGTPPVTITSKIAKNCLNCNNTGKFYFFLFWSEQ